MSQWNELASPPENRCFYQFSDHSGQMQRPVKDIDLDQNRTTLFQPKIKQDKMLRGNGESILNHYGEAVSINTSHKVGSSQKSTTKVNSKNHESAFDLKTRAKKQGHSRQQSRSMLDNKKQKSSVNLSHKIQSSSVIREQPSRVSTSSKNGKSFLKRIDNEEEDGSFSRILANDISMDEKAQKQKQDLISMDSSCFYEMMTTLRQIRDISKESLLTKKKLVRLVQDRSQVSFLYDRDDRSEFKNNKSKKVERKSYKRTQEKSSIKKLGKSIMLEQRLGKVEQKLRNLSKKVDEDTHVKKGGVTVGLGRTTKKSTSVLR